MAYDDDGHLSICHAVLGIDHALLRTGQTTRTSHWHRYFLHTFLITSQLTDIDFWFLLIDYSGAFFSLMALGTSTCPIEAYHWPS